MPISAIASRTNIHVQLLDSISSGGLLEGDDKKNMLTVQSMRNTLMEAIFIASITILINMALAALTNNAYSTRHSVFISKFLGSKSTLKYGSASLCLVLSFLFSSMAIGFLIDANFLMNTHGEFLSWNYTNNSRKRVHIGSNWNRFFCVSVSLMLWMIGPVTVFLASLGLVCLLHEFDFVSKVSNLAINNVSI
ncbi:hypothetical protein HN51_031117 [Arachis hypogaea]